ncbi:MAG TPA: hypothetical protein VF658_13540 [Pyrinomonadaceae bacterium]|jgi:hypothetical protein
MPDIELKTIKLDENEAKERAILHNNLPKGKPIFRGDGDWNYLCGKCRTVIGKQVPHGLPFVADGGKPVLVTCNSCGSYNEVPFAPRQ